MDVKDRASVQQAIDAIASALGPIDVLVNNAGVATTKAFLDVSEEDWAGVVDVNRGFFASDAGQTLIQRIPQRRIGQARELDGPLLLLASDASSYMTGSVLVADGGRLVSSL